MASWGKKNPLEESSSEISEFRFLQLRLRTESLKLVYKRKLQAILNKIAWGLGVKHLIFIWLYFFWQKKNNIKHPLKESSNLGKGINVFQKSFHKVINPCKKPKLWRKLCSLLKTQKNPPLIGLVVNYSHL